MTMKLDEKVRGVAADVLGADIGEITLATSQDNMAVWDSIQHLNLILALEDEFKTRITPDEAEHASSVAALVALLKAKLKLR